MNTSSTSEQFPGRLLPRSSDDSGYVMLMAMFAIIIGVGAVMLIFSSALFTVRQTKLGRERVQSTATAEAGLDSAFAALEQSTDVAFQVDEIDPETATGWTVLVRGTSGPADDGVTSISWLEGGLALGLAITASTIAGRVVSGTIKS